MAVYGGSNMGGAPRRPRHPRKELEELLRNAERRGWKVSKGRKYFKMKCPCGIHIKTVHLTPSDPRYLRNTLSLLARETCWERE